MNNGNQLEWTGEQTETKSRGGKVQQHIPYENEYLYFTVRTGRLLPMINDQYV